MEAQIYLKAGEHRRASGHDGENARADLRWRLYGPPYCHVKLQASEAAQRSMQLGVKSQFCNPLDPRRNNSSLVSESNLLLPKDRQDGCYVQRRRPPGRITLGASVMEQSDPLPRPLTAHGSSKKCNADDEQLAIATLATTFGVPYLLTRGGGSKQTTTPPLNAGSKDEEKFIQ